MDILDLIKFIMSFVIIAIHTRLFNEAIYPFARIAVPVFFILSGFFAFMRLDKIDDLSEKKKQLIHILKRYMSLYLFWFVILLPYTLYTRHYFQQGVLRGIVIIIRSFFLSSTFGGSWYIMAPVIGIYLVFVLSGKFSNAGILILTIPFYLFSTLFSEIGGLIEASSKFGDAYLWYCNYIGEPWFSFFISLVYISIGKIIADNKDYYKNKNVYKVLFIISLVLLIAEYKLVSHFEFFTFNGDCWIMLAPVASFFVMSIINININLKHAILLRKLSTIIYCSHMPTAVIVDKILGMLVISDPMHIINFVLTSLIVITLGLIILKLEKCEKLKLLRYAH